MFHRNSWLMNTKKILVVDDSLVIVKVLTLKLKSAGYEVINAPDGATAVATARQHKPDLIILDINFPLEVDQSWDAFSIMQWIRRIDGAAQIPVIIITSGDPAQFKERSLAAGAIAFFHKPIDHDALVATIQKTLGETGVQAQPTA